MMLVNLNIPLLYYDFHIQGMTIGTMKKTHASETWLEDQVTLIFPMVREPCWSVKVVAAS